MNIPSVINGYAILYIRYDAFKNKGITSVKIPNTVTNIGNSAFEGNLLTSIKIPDSVKNIGRNAFRNNNIEEIELHDNIEEIGDYAFAYNKLKKLKVPVLPVVNDNEYSDGYTFAYNEIEELIIPLEVKQIRRNMFSNNKLKGTFTVPIHLESVLNYAFINNEIEKVIIKSNDTLFGERSGFSSNKITDFEVPTGFSQYHIFSNNLLETVKIPNGSNIKQFNLYQNPILIVIVQGNDVNIELASISDWADWNFNNPESFYQRIGEDSLYPKINAGRYERTDLMSKWYKIY